MKIVLAPVGTRGDVQPLVALALSLRTRGHDVLFSAPDNFAEFVASFDLPFAPIAPDYSQFLQELQNEPFLEVLTRQVPEQFRLLDEIAEGADAIVGSMLQLAGPSVAEKHSAAYCFVMPAPVFVRSREYPPVTERRQDLSPSLNDQAWRQRGSEWNRVLLEPINHERSKFGLQPVSDAQDYVLHNGQVLLAYDPVLAPTPLFHYPRVEVTGSWHLDEGKLNPELQQFCERAPQPIFMGFGSMVTADAQRLLRMIVEGIEQSAQRAIIGAGWSGMNPESLPSSCRLIRTAPFHLLFPRVAAAIHHGGAGTTAAAARAGVPQGIVPHFSDQFFWGERIRQCGLGPSPIPICDLNAGALARMIQTLVFTPSLRERALEVSSQIDPQSSLLAGVRSVEAHVVKTATQRGRFR